MYSFGNKRKHGEKAKQQATRERVAPTQTVILTEKQLEDLTDLIYNQFRRNLCHKQRWKSPDLRLSKEGELIVVDPLGRWTRVSPGAKANMQLVPEPLKKFEGESEKNNCSQMIPQEEDIEDSIQQTTNQPKGDIGPINEAYKPDPEELSSNSTFSRNSTHHGVTEKKNWSKSFPHEEDMQLTSWKTSNESERDQRLQIEEFQSNQDEPSCKITCFGNLIHQRLTENWIHFKIPYGLKVIQLLNQEMLGLPYFEAHGCNHLQTRLWRPGEVLNHSRDIYNHPGGSSAILEGSDLRTNPFKGGGDGVISISLSFRDLKINNESDFFSSNHDHFTQSNSYGGHSGRAKSHLVHAESRDGRNSLLPDRSELVRPPEQLREAMLVSNGSRFVSAHLHTRDKGQNTQEHTKDELGLLIDGLKKVLAEQSPYWPMKLKDRPPWASTTNYGRGPRREGEEWVNLLVQLLWAFVIRKYLE